VLKASGIDTVATTVSRSSRLALKKNPGKLNSYKNLKSLSYIKKGEGEVSQNIVKLPAAPRGGA